MKENGEDGAGAAEGVEPDPEVEPPPNEKAGTEEGAAVELVCCVKVDVDSAAAAPGGAGALDDVAAGKENGEGAAFDSL